MGLRLKELTFSRGQQRVLGPLTGELEAGLTYGVVGPNGSGKSTLLRLLYGYLQPQSGTLHLQDKELDLYSPQELAQRVGALPQEAESTLDFTVEQALALATGGVASRVAQRLEALPFLGLELHLQKRLSQLSGGEKQRVRLGRALLVGSPWLLLDEPANHLDLRATWSLMDYLRQPRESGGVVIALHDLALAVRFCHRLYLLHEGREVVTGTPQEVLTKENLRSVFGLEGEVLSDDDGPRLQIAGVSEGE